MAIWVKHLWTPVTLHHDTHGSTPGNSRWVMPLMQKLCVMSVCCYYCSAQRVDTLSNVDDVGWWQGQKFELSCWWWYHHHPALLMRKHVSWLFPELSPVKESCWIRCSNLNHQSIVSNLSTFLTEFYLIIHACKGPCICCFTSDPIWKDVEGATWSLNFYCSQFI